MRTNRGTDWDETTASDDDCETTAEGLSRREILCGAIGVGVALGALGCKRSEGNVPSSDGGRDVSGSDGGTDAGAVVDADAGADGRVDAGADAGAEARAEAGGEARVEAGGEARAEAGGEARAEAGGEARVDAGADAYANSDTDTDTDSDTDSDMGKAYLAAACGTYCGACPSYIATHPEDEQLQYSNPWGECDGCLGGGRLAAHCKTCNIRLCALDKQNVTRCCDCEDLPCHRITNLINFGNYPHRKEYLPNLEKIREMGVREWVRYEEERWRCPQCRLPMRWYDEKCVRCGEPRAESLFPVSEDTPRPY